MPAEVAHQANIGLALRLLRDHLLPTIEEWLAGEYPGVEPLEAARNFVDGQIQAPRRSSEQDAGRKGREAIPIRPRELEDPRFLLTLLDLAGSTGLGRKLSVGRSSAAVRSLMRTRDAWAHFKPLSWETVYTAFTDVIAVLESARATSGRDEAIGLRDELVAHKALYEGGGVPLLRAVDRDEWRQRAELSVAEVAATAAALHTAKQRLAEREQMLRDARQRQEAAESEATDARLRESEARRITTRAEARAGKLEEGLRQVVVVTERLQGGRRSQSTGDTGQPRATGLKRSAAASPPGTAGTQRPGRSRASKRAALPTPVLPKRTPAPGASKAAVGPALQTFSFQPCKSKRREVLRAVVQIVAGLKQPQGVQRVRLQNDGGGRGCGPLGGSRNRSSVERVRRSGRRRRCPRRRR